MKKILLVMFVVIAFYGYSQSEVKLINKDGIFKIEYKGKEFDANENILTIKPKVKAYLPENIELVRENKLGFIDVKIPKGRDIEEYADELQKTGLFDVVEFNAYGEYNTFTPNDALLANQWHLSKIMMYDAWDITTGSSCVIVGILDSGIDWEHEDIGQGTDSYQNIFLNLGEDEWSDINDPSTGNGVDDDSNGLTDDWKGWNYSNTTNDSRPTYYHGTFVSGIVSAKTNNSIGIAGISGGNNNTGVRLLSYCIGYTAPDGSIIDDAIIDAVDMGAKVINLSFSISTSSAINTAIQYAINNNVVVVGYSGNFSSSSVSYPASNSNVIAVGASTISDTRASFSNYGTELDVVAPGVDIFSTSLNDNYTISRNLFCSASSFSNCCIVVFD
ncbi:MAG: S8 family serine peptidase [Bacteroidales bacterium]|nr:S8 family serine peptidase [Bacteroidales bacterium]